MPKKYNLKNHKSVQNTEKPNMEKRSYEGNVSTEDIMALEKELYGLKHGSVSLTLFIRDGKFQHSKVVKEFTRSCEQASKADALLIGGVE